MSFYYDAKRISDLEFRMRNMVAVLGALERKAEGNKVQLDNIADDEGKAKLIIKELSHELKLLQDERQRDWTYLTTRSDNCVERLEKLEAAQEEPEDDGVEYDGGVTLTMHDKLRAEWWGSLVELGVELGAPTGTAMTFMAWVKDAMEQKAGDGGDAQVWLEKIVAMAERHDALDTDSNYGGFAGQALRGLEARCVTHGWWREIYELADAELGMAEGGIEARDQILQAIRDAAKYRRLMAELGK